MSTMFDKAVHASLGALIRATGTSASCGHRGAPAIALAGMLMATAASGQINDQAHRPGDKAAEAQQTTDTSRAAGPDDRVEPVEYEDASESGEDVGRRGENEQLSTQKSISRSTEAMNVATQRLAEHSYYSTIGLLIGTVLLLLNLGYTHMAHRAALKAISMTRCFGKRQLRAYINVDEVHAEFPGGEGPVILVVRLRNFGATPAYRVAQQSESILAPYPWVGRNELVVPSASSACLGPGADFVAAARLEQVEPGAFEKAMQDVRSGSHGLWVHGIVRYTDAFGDQHVTRYRYVLGGRLAASSNALHATYEGNEAD